MSLGMYLLKSNQNLIGCGGRGNITFIKTFCCHNYEFGLLDQESTAHVFERVSYLRRFEILHFHVLYSILFGKQNVNHDKMSS